MQRLLIIFSAVLTLLPMGNVLAAMPTVSISPNEIIQGEPLKITVEGVSGTISVKKITFADKTLNVFSYQGKPTALVGVDLNKKPGTYQIVVYLSDGVSVEKTISVGAREKVEAPLGIPDKLGGNTPTAAKQVVNTLALENQSIYSVRAFGRALWTEDFKWPISQPIVVTDSYGYSRQTVGYSITHKGTDFRAKEGTVVSAMNRGIVRIARTYQIYGKTVIIDHGLGLHTVYMHLSRIKVNEGELVKAGQLIGLSGKTGYAESPHLHLSVWISGVSIDPMKFMELLAVE
jgi:murein DD-endopeptidase MepM/ murein hydrolase activator NlpD